MTISTANTPLTRPTFLRGLGRLVANYRPSIPRLDSEALLVAWWSVLEPVAGDGTQPGRWLTAALYDEAVTEVLATVTGYLPTVAQFLEVCRYLKADGEREAQRTTLALSVLTALPSRYDRAAWDRNVAIGRARIRKRVALIAQWRAASGQRLGEVPPEVWQGLDEPDEAEITAVLAG